ncbi:MAG: hypothetical protein WBL50_02000 [Candidatus Acidiferrum sp.]
MNPLTEKNKELVWRFDRWRLVLRYSPITRDMYARAARSWPSVPFGLDPMLLAAQLGLARAYMLTPCRATQPKRYAMFLPERDLRERFKTEADGNCNKISSPSR